jgi:hypothetical protein
MIRRKQLVSGVLLRESRANPGVEFHGLANSGAY